MVFLDQIGPDEIRAGFAILIIAMIALAGIHAGMVETDPVKAEAQKRLNREHQQEERERFEQAVKAEMERLRHESRVADMRRAAGDAAPSE